MMDKLWILVSDNPILTVLPPWPGVRLSGDDTRHEKSARRRGEVLKIGIQVITVIWPLL